MVAYNYPATQAKPEFSELEYGGHPGTTKPEPNLRLGSSGTVYVN